MQDARTWRELLGQIIRDNKEKQRLIEVLNVMPITLTRWVNGESEPRPQNLRQLLQALPQYRDDFRKLMRENKGVGSLSETVLEEVQKEIPAEFYAHILLARASTSENLRFWSTCHLILQQAIGQLDPARLGMSIWVVRCMPPSGSYQKVRSLRESVGMGTPPWIGNLEQKAMFLGAESLAGNVVTQCRPAIIQNLEEQPTMMPTVRTEHEKSAAIYPILYAGRIAGVLLVSSAIQNYFQSPTRVQLLQNYVDLVALAFEPDEFYELNDIALCVMPPQKEQEKYFANFRQRVTETMLNAANSNQPVNNIQADMIVWQQLEEELLNIPARHPLQEA
jgi:hypothetical protein